MSSPTRRPRRPFGAGRAPTAIAIVTLALAACGGAGEAGRPAAAADEAQPASTRGGTTPASDGALAGAAAAAADAGYPTQWIWSASGTLDTMPRAATEADGFAPRIEQVRGGRVVATYAQLGSSGRYRRELDPARPDEVDPGGGAFSRLPYRNWAPGDVFLVYPAVYRGEDQQPWIGPSVDSDADYRAGRFVTPRGISIRGVTVNGVRPVISLAGVHASNNTLGQGPVYVDASEDVTIENIDIDARGAASGSQGGVYVNGARNLVLRDMRIHGFRERGGNGVFGTNNNAGTLRLENLVLHDNGGDAGPEHNVYVNASTSDPAFTVQMRGSWSHSVYYGHLFKSRAQRTVLEGNYFMGARAAKPAEQWEAFLVDVPDGGELTMRNNVLAKNRSGPDSNGVFLSFGVERFGAERSHRFTVEHNTFAAFACTFDGLHPLQPLFVNAFDPARPPAGVTVEVRGNALLGFCPLSPIAPVLSAGGLVGGIERLAQDFTIASAPPVAGSAIVGSEAYAHVARTLVRERTTVGARD